MPVAELRAYALAMIASAAAWDVAGALGALPQWWPPVSYVCIAAGIAAACLAGLFGMFARPRLPPRDPAGSTAAHDSGVSGSARSTRPAGRIGGQLLAAGLLLAAWLLRGDAEIPPDPPLVAAELAGAVLYAFAARRDRSL